MYFFNSIIGKMSLNKLMAFGKHKVLPTTKIMHLDMYDKFIVKQSF